MNVTLAFTAHAMTEDEGRADVLRQAREWADAERHWQWAGVIAGPVRPYPDREHWWEVDVRLEPRVGSQLALWR